VHIMPERDHGGGLDAAISRYGGNREGWLDLSTGINPQPYDVPHVPMNVWTALPDRAAAQALIDAVRHFWSVPDTLSICAVPGASAAIAHIPLLAPCGRVTIPGPTYNEHAASFAANGWQVTQEAGPTQASVHVHPNNPDGRLWCPTDLSGDLRVVDESFCDVMPDASLIHVTDPDKTLILKSFGKFWGLAGLRLGFVIGPHHLTTRLTEMLGPWPVSGPAQHIGTAALRDQAWADTTRQRLARDAKRLDHMITGAGADLVGGTTLFRLYKVDNAAAWQSKLARHHIWSRIFPYNGKWLRLGLPPANGWDVLKAALT